jgi:hypothetical protein
MPGEKLSVRIRMYRQGLGDCFLLTFSAPDNKKSHMLIDCGLFQATTNGKGIMTKVAEDIKKTSGDRLDAVLVTHEHWDHISGFSLAKNVFDDVKFKFNRVWVGWTENNEDKKVDEVKQRFEKKKKGLRAALARMDAGGLSGVNKTIDSLVNEFFGLGEVDPLGMSGADTWKYILNKSEVQPPKYCTPGEIHTLDGIDGVRIYILGPPEDIEKLDDEESPTDETYRTHLRAAVTNSFLAAATGPENSDFDSNTYFPFDAKYRIESSTAEKPENFEGFFVKNYGFDEAEETEWRRIDEDWLQLAGDLALNIDGITNNTCLAIAIELIDSGKVLLFPGDAQFGNWISWKKLEWDVPQVDGSMRKVKIDELLKRTVFYKVGHHGSHNATLRKSGLEMMKSPELVAMIPTNVDFAKNKITEKTPEGWKMPEPELMTALEKSAKGRVSLADEVGAHPDLKSPLRERCQGKGLAAGDVEKFLGNVEFEKVPSMVRNPKKSPDKEPLFVDYTVE